MTDTRTGSSSVLNRDVEHELRCLPDFNDVALYEEQPATALAESA